MEHVEKWSLTTVDFHVSNPVRYDNLRSYYHRYLRTKTHLPMTGCVTKAKPLFHKTAFGRLLPFPRFHMIDIPLPIAPASHIPTPHFQPQELRHTSGNPEWDIRSVESSI